MFTQAEALAQGYTVDEARRIAYRGPRYAPTAVVPVLTQYEAELRAALQAIADASGDVSLTALQGVARDALR